MANIELKPCPFCGETRIYVEKVGAFTPTGFGFSVRCGNIPYCGAIQRWFYTEEDAIEAWNRRYANENPKTRQG